MDTPLADAAVIPLSPHVIGEPVVVIEGLRKSFGAREVLCGIDLCVRAGEHVVIFGPSGSGKSTLLRSINLLEEPSRGSLKVFDVEYGPDCEPGVRRGNPLDLRRTVGMVFQQFNLFPHMTALENVALPQRAVRRDQACGGRGARRAGAAPCRPAAPRRPLPRRALRRPAAARRDRAGAQPRPQDHAVRRADLGTRRRTGRRGARGHARARRGRHDDGRSSPTSSASRERSATSTCSWTTGMIVESGDRTLFDSCTNPRLQKFVSAVL